jgi:hypothetical protein
LILREVLDRHWRIIMLGWKNVDEAQVEDGQRGVESEQVGDRLWIFTGRWGASSTDDRYIDRQLGI